MAVNISIWIQKGVGAQGRLATLDNAVSHAAQFGVHPEQALHIVRAMAMRVREWRLTFERLGVPVEECNQVATAFRRPRDVGLERAEEMLRRPAARKARA